MSDRLDGVESTLSGLICEVYLEGRGSLITRRGLIELSRGALASTLKEIDE